MRIGGYVAFGCDCDDFDPDGAAIALRRAGFDVMRMPERFRSRMEIPQDDFILVSTEATAGDEKVLIAVMREISAIVDRYGGDLSECGPILSDHVPFEELFEWRPRLH
jgi:hypothetical protein